MTKDEILRDLRQAYGPKVILSPEDLALAIGRSPKAQANMRSRVAFPMPVKRVGGKIGVSVYDLADYLAGDSTIEQPAATARATDAPAMAPDHSLITPRKKSRDGAAKAATPKSASTPKPWLPARSRKSLGAELLGFRQALDFWGAVHAELEAAELAAILPDKPRTRTRPRSV